MKVALSNNRTDVESIKQGGCFLHKGLLYMRLSIEFGAVNGPCKPGAVNLASGDVIYLAPDTQVERASYVAVPCDEEEFEV